MRRNIYLLCGLLLTLFVLGCKPIELRQLDGQYRTVTAHSDTAVSYIQVYDGHSVPRQRPDRDYYWFAAGKIGVTQGGFSGKLLDGPFRSHYPFTKQLKESGQYRKGLKTGKWLRWYPSGKLKQIKVYRDGLLHGATVQYDTAGLSIDTIKYRNGKEVIKSAVRDTTLALKIKRFLRLKKK